VNLNDILFWRQPWSERWFVRRYHDRAHRRAMEQSPLYREIEERSDGRWISNEERGITVDMYFQRFKIADAITPRPWWYKLHWWMEENGYSAQRRTIKRFVQRGRRGWADEDLWSLDSWLARVISDSTLKLTEYVGGYPNELNSVDEWRQILEKISDGFKNHLLLTDILYLSDHPDEEQALRDSSDEAMKLFGKYFSDLWD
jgi:hypothetical protein